jgi:hypothetical protein
MYCETGSPNRAFDVNPVKILRSTTYGGRLYVDIIGAKPVRDRAQDVTQGCLVFMGDLASACSFEAVKTILKGIR